MNVHTAYNLQPSNSFHKQQLVPDCTANSSKCLKKILGFLENHVPQIIPGKFFRIHLHQPPS